MDHSTCSATLEESQGRKEECLQARKRVSDGVRDMRVSEAHDLVTLKQERVLDSDKQDNRRSQLDLE